MLTRRQFTTMGAATGAAILAVAATGPALAENAEVIKARVNLAMGRMYSQIPQTRQLASKARAMLVMPDVVKGGLIVGGAYGEGALILNDPVKGYESEPIDYYSVAAASFGLQAGVQTSSHVLFFMTDEGLQSFRRLDGWELGADAEVTFPDAGLNAQVNTTLLEKPIIGYVFGQDGFMAGVSLEGAKYSRLVR